MDRGDPMIIDALKGLLPEQTLEQLQFQLQNPQSAAQALLRQATLLFRRATTLFYPLLAPLAARALQAARDSPDAVVLVAALAAFVFVLRVIALLHRAVLMATRLAFRLLGWALVAALVAAVWRRGPDAALRDLVVVLGKLAGYAAVVRDIWWSEYQKFDAQTRSGGAAPGGGMGGPGVGSAGSRGGASSGYARSRNSGW
ncbi:hypothetical protein GGR52DRAFT_136934 [Hypoxylon sp. FL1284]|nr:hypothetical protein GGR52DRAFT_136934 [Hypoxylon sp. FL1284]